MSSFVNVIFVDVSITVSSIIKSSTGTVVVITGRSGILLIIYSSEVISVVMSL